MAVDETAAKQTFGTLRWGIVWTDFAIAVSLRVAAGLQLSF